MEYFPTAYQSVIYKTRYSRWMEDQKRREEWPETVRRYVDFMFDRTKREYGYENEALKEDVYQHILNLEVMPSMRALMTAGPALERSNIAGYNCAYLAIDEPIAFDEALYILMNGTGVGFSVERKFTERLPSVPENFDMAEGKYLVGDSKEGWAEALRHVVLSLFNGIVPDWDLSDIRPKGARLKTFGGRASGPQPLDDLLNFVVRIFLNASGRKLTPMECHEIMCMVGDIVVVGGVRRAALISLSDLSDEELRDAKSGSWWEEKGHLRLANNSAVYLEKPTRETFDEEWAALKASGSGERGMFSRYGAEKKAAAMGRDLDYDFGVNPCGEIILRNKGFCNLSSIVIRPEDTRETLKKKAEIATVIGTLQSSLTDFPYLSDKWKKNAEEERLLGVSIGGVFNNPLMYERGRGLEEFLRELRDYTVAVNRKMAHDMGINPSKSITTIKPEGNSSQLTGVSSGIHPWHDEFYIRNIRGNDSDPISEFLEFYGVKTEEDVMSKNTKVFSFPIMAPEDAKTRKELTAIEHLEVWLAYSENWAHHNPSVTVNIREHEWDEVADWVYDHFDRVVGVSFLPYDDHTYQQAPYEPCNLADYFKLEEKTPDSLPWEALSTFELEDSTTSSQELACMAGGCTIEAI